MPVGLAGIRGVITGLCSVLDCVLTPFSSAIPTVYGFDGFGLPDEDDRSSFEFDFKRTEKSATFEIADHRLSLWCCYVHVGLPP
jgi:hypothetical protein